jgi:hypothetical protein
VKSPVSKNLKGKATAGYDDIPESLLKHCIHLVKKPLAHIYDIPLNSGVFPDEWKVVKVKPLFKKGDRYEMNNYRPIAIISVFAKLLERVMYNRLIPSSTRMGYFQKPKMVLEKVNVLKQLFSHL